MIFTVTLTPALDKTVVIPSFTPGCVNRIEHIRLDAGGKGINVSKTIHALGGSTVACGILGGDSGRFILQSLREEGIECCFAEVEESTRTNLKIVDPVLHQNTDINEPGAPVAPEILEKVIDMVIARAHKGDTVVLSGKAPQNTDPGIFAGWTRRLHALGIEVCMDCDGEIMAEGIKAHPCMIKPNDEELSRLMGRKFRNPEEIALCARQLVSEGIGTVVVSMGGDGAIFAREGQVYRGFGIPVNVQSTVGAGDATLGAMCFGQDSGMDFAETCRLALAAGAAAVMTSGTQSVSGEQVKELMKKAVVEKI